VFVVIYLVTIRGLGRKKPKLSRYPKEREVRVISFAIVFTAISDVDHVQRLQNFKF
jgi:hypothetical protein